MFGGLSVILYKPWRRRIDKRRVRDAHFEPLSQDPSNARAEEEEIQAPAATRQDVIKDPNVNIEPVERTDEAGPVDRV